MRPWGAFVRPPRREPRDAERTTEEVRQRNLGDGVRELRRAIRPYESGRQLRLGTAST